MMDGDDYQAVCMEGLINDQLRVLKKHITPCLCRCGRLILQRLLETVQRCSDTVQYSALTLLRELFACPGMDVGAMGWLVDGCDVLTVLTGLLATPAAELALQVMEVRREGGGCECGLGA